MNPTPEARDRVVNVLVAATFLIFFQAFMVAPLIPRLAEFFHVPLQTIGWVVPAYMVPYALSTVIYGVLADRIGRRRVILGSMIGFLLVAALTATAGSAIELLIWRVVAGMIVSAVVPQALASVGALYPYEQRGRPLGKLFGAMAGGMAFGSTFGVVVDAAVGWRALFLGLAVLGAVLFVLILRRIPLASDLGTPSPRAPFATILRNFRNLLVSPRGATTYGYVLLNGVFHSGVFTWLGAYFKERYQLGEVGIGIALLGYGVPGFLLGPVIGRAADRFGRRFLIPAGLLISAVAAGCLLLNLPVVAAALAVTALSLGYDMTQPLLAGIVTSLGSKAPGQAMGLNVFALFLGFGTGSIFFGELYRRGWPTALAAFSGTLALAAVVALFAFRLEDHRSRATATP